MCSRVLFLLAILLLLENCIASEVLGLVQSSYHAEYNPLARAEPVPNDKSKMSFTLLVQSNFSDGLKSRAPPNTPDYVAQAQANGICFVNTLKFGGEPQSVYTDYSELSSSGWREVQVQGTPPLPPLNSFLQANKQWAPGNFHLVQWEYPQPWLGSAAGGFYQIWISIQDGVILISNVRAPDSKKLTDPAKLPPTRNPPSRLSDWIFLIHTHLCGGSLACLQRLQYVVHEHVTNYDTYGVANWVVYGPDQSGWNQFPSWANDPFQGATFAPDADTAGGPTHVDGNTLLGTPNGLGVAYLLSQHRNQYGPKIVDEINVFSTDDSALAIAYHIVVQ